MRDVKLPPRRSSIAPNGVLTDSKELVRASFSERAAEWAACYDGREPDPLTLRNLRTRQRFALQLVETGLPPGSKILDVGCGPGEMAARLMERGYQVWGVDIAEPMIQHARARCGTDHFRVGDIEQLPFQDSTFDGVVCLGVIEYLDSDTTALREIGRVLAPGGKAVISTPSAVSPLHRLDRMVAAAERIYQFAKRRLRRDSVPTLSVSRGVAHRTYSRGNWLHVLRSTGLEPEEWICYGWGWYNSRLGPVVEALSRIVARFRGIIERVLGRKLLDKSGDRLARSRLINWTAYEQLVSLRVMKESETALS